MKDAFGGILNIVIVAVFLVIVSGILGMTVNYTKAFKMKNVVISSIEKYEGYGCFTGDSDSACLSSIEEGAKSIGYHPVDVNCPSSQGFKRPAGNRYFCYKRNNSSNGNLYYTVTTQVDIDIPIINKIMGLSFFQVHGDTRIIQNKYHVGE